MPPLRIILFAQRWQGRAVLSRPLAVLQIGNRKSVERRDAAATFLQGGELTLDNSLIMAFTIAHSFQERLSLVDRWGLKPLAPLPVTSALLARCGRRAGFSFVTKSKGRAETVSRLGTPFDSWPRPSARRPRPQSRPGTEHLKSFEEAAGRYLGTKPSKSPPRLRRIIYVSKVSSQPSRRLASRA